MPHVQGFTEKPSMVEFIAEFLGDFSVGDICCLRHNRRHSYLVK